MWLERPDQWEKLVEHLRAAGEFGLDTETYGQPDRTSPQHRARVHCWSVGVLTATASPRGFRRAVGRVLPAAALQHPAVFSVLMDPAVRKWAHNAPHDRHALENEGVEVRGLEDSLQWFRVAQPGLRDYGLKDAEVRVLGYPPRPGWLDLVSYRADVESIRYHTERRCVCGAVPCRKRTTAVWMAGDGETRTHQREELRIGVPVVRTEVRRYAVTDFIPGANLQALVWSPTKTKPTAPTWWTGRPLDRLEEWWKYSLADAVRGIELVDWLRNLKPTKVVYPWQLQSS